MNKTFNLISYDELIYDALYHPDRGFYTSQKYILGKNGSFITSPEVSQLFGEIIAFYLIDIMLNDSNFKIFTSFNIIEIGAGSGQMMFDILRIFSKVTNFKLNIHIIDISENLQQMQKKKLEPFKNKYIFSWYNNISELNLSPNIPNFVVANELFDAMPAKVILKKNNLWYEKKLSTNYQIHYELIIEKNFIDHLNEFFSYIQNDEEFDCPIIYNDFLKLLFNKISISNFKFLFVDYGFIKDEVKKFNSTYQAIYKHQKINLFDKLYESDITYLVNFSYLQEICLKLGIMTKVFSQKEFLINNGIDYRMALLKKNITTKHESIELETGYFRLLNIMGNDFKLLVSE